MEFSLDTGEAMKKEREDTILKDNMFFNEDSIQDGVIPDINEDTELELAVEQLTALTQFRRELDIRGTMSRTIALEARSTIGADSLISLYHYSMEESQEGVEETKKSTGAKIKEWLVKVWEKIKAYIERFKEWFNKKRGKGTKGSAENLSQKAKEASAEVNKGIGNLLQLTNKLSEETKKSKDAVAELKNKMKDLLKPKGHEGESSDTLDVTPQGKALAKYLSTLITSTNAAEAAFKVGLNALTTERLSEIIASSNDEAITKKVSDGVNRVINNGTFTELADVVNKFLDEYKTDDKMNYIMTELDNMGKGDEEQAKVQMELTKLVQKCIKADAKTSSILNIFAKILAELNKLDNDDVLDASNESLDTDGMSLNVPNFLGNEELTGRLDGTESVEELTDEELNTIETEISSSLEALERLRGLEKALESRKTISRSFALESIQTVGTGVLLPENYYTIHDSKTGYEATMESVNTRIKESVRKVIEWIKKTIKKLWDWLRRKDKNSPEKVINDVKKEASTTPMASTDLALVYQEAKKNNDVKVTESIDYAAGKIAQLGHNPVNVKEETALYTTTVNQLADIMIDSVKQLELLQGFIDGKGETATAWGELSMAINSSSNNAALDRNIRARLVKAGETNNFTTILSELESITKRYNLESRYKNVEVLVKFLDKEVNNPREELRRQQVSLMGEALGICTRVIRNMNRVKSLLETILSTLKKINPENNQD